MEDCLLLSQLINARSTQADGELAAALVLKDFFAGSGIETKVDVWDKTRANFTALLKGTDPRRGAVIFFSHLDVVPADDEKWQTPPFDAIRRSGRIYGRGAVDMKGAIAAAAVAMKRLASDGYRPACDIILAGTAGEETDSCGILKMLKPDCDTFANPAAVIVTEPTDMKPIVAHKGILWLAITVRGRCAHGSAPHLGSNAVHKMCGLVTEIQKLELGFPAHPKLGANTISVNAINGGVATNVVPDLCRCEVDMRLLPGQSPQSVVEKVNGLLERLKSADPEFIAEMKIIRSVAAFETIPGSSFVKELCDMLNKTPQPINFTTDAPYLTFLNCPIVIIGPGDPGLCHKSDEFIEINEFQDAIKTYTQIIRRFAAAD